MRKIAIIGHFGGNEKFYDGQTVKTKNLEQLLIGCGSFNVYRVDTYLSKINKIKLFIKTIVALLSNDYIFLLVSVNGLRVFLPLLYYLNKIIKKPIFHYVIGSELLEIVSKDKKMVKYLNSFEENWFEYESGTKFLENLGVKNVKTVPNFKNIQPVSKVNPYQEDSKYLFCTFSRVMKEKGITEAINVVEKINRKYGADIAFLDIYGPIDLSYSEEFEALLQKYSNFISYKGIVDSGESVSVLTQYFALLFPTMWHGEGFPGTIIDAFAAGIPIIASDWNANKEIMQNKIHGLIYPSIEFKSLYEAIEWAIEHVNEFNEMRISCRNEFEKYTPESVLKVILEVLK